MKKILLFLLLFIPVVLSGQAVINLDKSSLGTLNTLLLDNMNMIWVSLDNTTGVETGSLIYPYNTIQEGLDAANSGNAVIVLAPASDTAFYNEHLVMSTNNVRLMTLEDQTVMVNLISSGGSGLDIGADSLVIGGGSGMGFTFTADDGLMMVIDADRSDVEISYNKIVVDGGGTIGINPGAAGATRLTVKNNLFIVSSGQGAFFAVKSLDDVAILDNEFQGADSTSGYAIQISGFTNGIIAGNFIHRGAIVAGGFASGIFPHTNVADSHTSDSLEIYNNIVQDCSNGIRLGHSNGADMKEIYIYGNILQRNTRGLFVHNDAQVYPATYDIYDNVFSDNEFDVSNDHATPLNYGFNALDETLAFESGSTYMYGVKDTIRMFVDNIEALRLFDDGGTARTLFGNGTNAAPAMSFIADDNTGFYRFSQFKIGVTLNGIKWNFSPTQFEAYQTDGAAILFNTPTSTLPGLVPNKNDANTGIGHADLDSLSLIAGGIEGIRVAEGGGDILVSAKGILTGGTLIALHTDPAIVLTDLDSCRNVAHFNNDADVIDFTLPGAEAGLVVTFYDIGGAVITVDPVDGTDTIYLNGTSVGAGDAIESPGAVGDHITLMAIDVTRWVTVNRSGVWVDSNP